MINHSIVFRFLVLFFLITTALNNSFAAVELRSFNDPEKEALYKELIFELRCLVCQNQNLADSNADLAVDLRRQTFDMIDNGSDKQGVIDYMVARYGEFVLYRPPFTAATLLIWLGPFFFLIASIFILLRIIRNKKLEKPTRLNQQEQDKIRTLLNEKNTD